MQQTLPQKWVDVLVNLPESGMGYQIVDITFKDGSIINRISVSNPNVFLPPNYNVEDIVKIEMPK